METKNKEPIKPASVRGYSKVVRQQYILIPREMIDFALRYPSVDWNQVINDAAKKNLLLSGKGSEDMDLSKSVIAGEKYDTKQLYEMGLIPPGFLVFLDDPPTGYPSSLVTDVNHKTRTITFDSDPSSLESAER